MTRLAWLVLVTAQVQMIHFLGPLAERQAGQLIEKAHEGGFTCPIAGGVFRHADEDILRIELRCTSGEVRGFVLAHPAANRAKVVPKWFALAADSGVPAADIATMEQLLDDVFPADPWLEREPQVKDLGRFAVDSQGVGKHDVTLAREVVLIALLWLSLALGVGYLWRTRP